MEQDDTLLSRVKNALASNKNVLGLVASYLLMLLCLVLFFRSSPDHGCQEYILFDGQFRHQSIILEYIP